jgi:hypothetical protein
VHQPSQSAAHATPLSLITLTTDFGLADSYAAIMKGVILGIAPFARIVDVTHQIEPQAVRQAALALQAAVPYFPPHTIHVAVVDPGVGSTRRPIAVRTPQGIFVGPDNGLFSTFLTDHPAGSIAVLQLDRPAYWLPTVSRTFHGRDIFAPVAAHLATGVSFEALGTAVDDPILLPASQRNRLPDGTLAGQIVAVDRFGNLISDLPEAWLAGRRWMVSCAGVDIAGPSETYASVAPGELVALISSLSTLEIALREGSAAARLRAAVGEPIQARPLV